MAKYESETLELRETYFDENDVQQEYLVNEYLVKRASDGYPVRQFKTRQQALDWINANEETDEN